MITATRLLVQAISPAHLKKIRSSSQDGYGNQVRPSNASGEGEALRCCLRFAASGEEITLISYAPFDHPSVSTEVGPVYIHFARCEGYEATGRLPDQLAMGPRVLRTYRPDHSMNYERNTVVANQVEIEPIITSLLAEDGVATIHVRGLASQCFLYAVTQI